MAIAALALVIIGAVEAFESARQIAESTAPLRITPSGVGVSSIGLLASSVVYVALGWRIGQDRSALRAGATAGLLAGLIGGAIRALIIADVVADAVARYAAVPEWFVPLALFVFVVGAIVVSMLAGGALALIGVRIARVTRSARS